MQIIKSKFFRPRKCEYGNFELKPEEGWKISQQFIDFESKLLIISVSIIDESKWIDLGHGSRSIPAKEYKIDLNTLKILEPSDWQKYFNYDKVDIISDDNKYKLVSERIFDKERNNDSFKEELYDLATNKLISSGSSVAFDKKKRENLLESLYRSINEREERKRLLDAKPTMDKFYIDQLNDLKDKDDILCYFDNSNTFKLSFINSKFQLFEGGKLPTQYQDWKSISFAPLKTYDNLDIFWQEFILNEKWFLKYNVHQSMSQKPLLLAKHIISYSNSLRKEHKFTYNEYEKLNDWENIAYSDEYKRTELKQWCSNCYKEVSFQGRYPKYICGDCASKDKLDTEGNLLEFYNLGFSGGFKIIRKDWNGNIINEDDTQQFCDLLIDDKVFFAQEARFGGIVIQSKE